MRELVYSTDEEIYNDNEMCEAAERVFDDIAIKVGDVRTIYSGEKVPMAASGFLHNLIEEMGERAYDECGEHCDSWPNTTKEQGDELECQVKALIDKWADKHGIQPTFYMVTNVKEIKVRLTSEDGDFEEVKEI